MSGTLKKKLGHAIAREIVMSHGQADRGRGSSRRRRAFPRHPALLGRLSCSNGQRRRQARGQAGADQ
jgi:hypothetical protein